MYISAHILGKKAETEIYDFFQICSIPGTNPGPYILGYGSRFLYRELPSPNLILSMSTVLDSYPDFQ